MTICVNVGLFTIIAWFLGAGIVLYGSVWLLGSVAYKIYERGWLKVQMEAKWFSFASFGLLALSLGMSKTAHGSEFQKDFFIGLATTLVVLSIAGRNTSNRIIRKAARAAADCLYTTYLVHFPFLAVLVTLILHESFSRLVPDTAFFF